jgi:hypothetical protein
VASVDKTMHLVVLAGLPGVGKYTIAGSLCLRTGYKNFHNHLVVDPVLSLFEFGSPPFVELREQLWYLLLRRAAREGVEGVVMTIAKDRTLPADFFPVLEGQLGAGGRMSVVELVCSGAELFRRLTDRSRAIHEKINSVEMFETLREAGAFSGPAFPRDRMIVDTTGLSVEESANAIIAELALPVSDIPR